MTRPIGAAVPDLAPRPAPPQELHGRFVTLARLRAEDAGALFAANGDDVGMWDYLPYGPWVSADEYAAWVAGAATGDDPAFYTLRSTATGEPGGIASFMRIDRANGVIEIGWIAISPGMQRTPASSEAIMVMIRWAFEAGYRRVEWKCNDLNAPSMRAAERYGFRYEGTFRKHLIVKGRNRDTAWWAITDDEWPEVGAAHAAWLSPGNFDEGGQQRQSLAALVVAARG